MKTPVFFIVLLNLFSLHIITASDKRSETYGMATTDTMPYDQAVSAPEFDGLFSADREGRILTVHTVPVINTGRSYAFKIPSALTPCEFKFANENVLLKQGDAYWIEDWKKRLKLIDNEEVLTVMILLKKITGYDFKRGAYVTSKANEDAVMFRCEMIVTGRKLYDPETVYAGVRSCFSSYMHEKRFGRKVLGQEALEKLTE